MVLFTKQTEAIEILEDSTTNQLLYGGSRGGGKTRLGVFWILKNCIKYPGTRWLIGRASHKMLMGTTMETFELVARQQEIWLGKHWNYHEHKSEIKFWNGSSIVLKNLEYEPSDPSYTKTLRGYEFSGAFLDEVNELTSLCFEIVFSNIRWQQLKGIDADGKPYQLIPKIFATCNPVKNWVYDEFFLPWQQNRLLPFRKFLPALATDNETEGGKAYVQSLMLMQDEGERQRGLYGNWDWDEDSKALIEPEALNDVFNYEQCVPDDSKKRLAADIALEGRDKFIVALFRGNLCEIVLEKPKAKPQEVERDLRKFMEQYNVLPSQTIFDAAGAGTYLDDYLKGMVRFHNQHAPINKHLFGSIWNECGYKLVEKINKRELKIKCTAAQRETLRTELSWLKMKQLDSQGRKELLPKKEIRKNVKHSPDMLDTVLMGMYFELRKPVQFIIPGFS